MVNRGKETHCIWKIVSQKSCQEPIWKLVAKPYCWVYFVAIVTVKRSRRAV